MRTLYTWGKPFIDMGQSIQEWTKQILWKTALKKFTESTLEYFAPYDL